ncbi:hypothetical protein [Hallella colorans]|uniref:hypothetical protein n=1 Tax=Hallella colorans TaxID=1703337 RepID=UPI0023F179B3|nr:hypothetical protein [Hallella colorans]
MKKLALAFVALLAITIQASAMSYEQAREQALFLTDKMAYELNLTEDQYEAAYEINLDYLMGIEDYTDLYGAYWTRRNLDLSYILLDWQYRTYVNAAYFYRPLYWNAGYWHFGVYARYPHRDYFYFGRPRFYVTYNGYHSWHSNGGRSWYRGRSFGGRYSNGAARVGMRDGFDRGDFGRGTRFSSNGNRSFGNGTRRIDADTRSFGNGNGRFGYSNRSFGNGGRSDDQRYGSPRSFGHGSFEGSPRSFGHGRQSSTRSTVTRPNSNPSFGREAPQFTAPRRTFTPRNSNGSQSFSNRPSIRQPNAPARSFGGGNGGSSNSQSTGGHFGRGR